MSETGILRLVELLVPVLLAVLSLVRAYCAERTAQEARRQAHRAQVRSEQARRKVAENHARLTTLEEGSVTKDMLITSALNAPTEMPVEAPKRPGDGQEVRDEVVHQKAG